MRDERAIVWNGRPEQPHCDCSRLDVGAGIYQDDERGLGEIEGQLGRQLVPPQQVRSGDTRIFRQLLYGVPAQVVVGAESVAVADDKHSRAGSLPRCHGDQRASSSITVPSGPRSWTCSAIWPNAWVEQLRHGS